MPVFPTTLTAANGSVTIKREPTRIVSLDPTATEDLYAMGAGTQVVAVDQNSDYPPGAPVTSLSGLTPNIEAIAKYSPSLVVASQDSGGLVSGLGKLGVPVLIEPAVATLTAAYQQIEQIGEATGHYNQATEVVRNMQEKINDTVRQVGAKYRGTDLLLGAEQRPVLLRHLGHVHRAHPGPVRAEEHRRRGRTSPPTAVTRSCRRSTSSPPSRSSSSWPTTRPPTAARPRPIVARRPGWADLPAVQDHDIFGLNDDIASRWGPRLPSLVNAIANALASSAKS